MLRSFFFYARFEYFSLDDRYLVALALGPQGPGSAPAPAPVPLPAKTKSGTGTGTGTGVVRGLGRGIGGVLSHWMGLHGPSSTPKNPPSSPDRSPSAIECPTLLNSPPIGIECPTILTSPPLGIKSPPSVDSSPLGIECHFKPLRSLLSPVMGAHFDRVFPNAEQPPERILDVSHMYAEIEKQNAIFDLNETCAKCEKCDISCTML